MFHNPTAWLDVRAPVEFAAGAVPSATNLPLLTNEERHLIGIEYKKRGGPAAVDLGHKLVGGEVRAARTQAWAQFVRSHTNPVLYCFRGGLRSQIVQAWLREEGVECPLVAGGYKALRRFFLSELFDCVRRLQFIVVSGPTGSGKTQFLRSRGEPFVDLEGLARHRGSAFGALSVPQPSQGNFENALAVEFIRLSDCNRPILIEDESRLIGRNSLPLPLFDKMQTSPRLFVDVPLDARVENVFRDYVLDSPFAVENPAGRFTHYKQAVEAIARRLGGLRTTEVLADIEAARREFGATGNLDLNRIWIRKLLLWYYDPLYARSQEVVRTSGRTDLA